MANRTRPQQQKTNDWLETIEVERVDADDDNSEMGQSSIHGASISTPILRKDRTSGSNDHTSDGDSDSEMLAGIAIIDDNKRNVNRNSSTTGGNVSNDRAIYGQGSTTSDDRPDNTDSDSIQRYRRNSAFKLLVICILASILLIAVVVGSVCGSGKCPNGRENSAEAAQNQLDPTLKNDVCQKAVGPLTIGNIPYLGLLSGLQTTSQVPICNGGITSTSTVAASGRWFKVTGGDDVIRVSTCDRQHNFTTTVDTAITIYQGDDCDSLTCVASNDDFCGSASSVSLQGEKGVNYYIFVTMIQEETESNVTSALLDAGGSNRTLPNIRNKFDFVLTVDFEDNGQCDKAIGPIAPVAPLNISSDLLANDYLVGSLRGSSSQPLSMKCDSNAALGGNVWYTVKGTGSWLKASTCHNITEFEARLDVTSGSCGDSSECAAVRDSDCKDFGHQIVWKSDVDTVYNLAVYKDNFSEGSVFGLSIEPFDPVSNDQCDQAQSIKVDGSKIIGSTLDATFDVDSSACPNSVVSRAQPGVWYKVTGTGNTMLASTCHEETDFATEITVYVLPDESLCTAGLTCVTSAQKQFCKDDKAAIFWDSQDGQVYLIHVHGSDYGTSPNVGDFVLSVADFVTASNDVCANANPMYLSGAVQGNVEGSTLSATPDLSVLSCNVDPDVTPGVWYSVAGNGAILSASTCNPFTTFDTQISVFSDDCTSLSCVVTNDNSCGLQSFVAWSTDVNVTYHILVHGGSVGSPVGEFVLDVEEYEAKQENDFCADAIPIEFNGTVYQGSTVQATYDNIGECIGLANTAPGVWYTAIGTGRRVTASLCNPETNYSATISVLAGNCTTQMCVASGSYNGAAGCSKVTWLTTLDEVYNILVHGAQEQVGSLGLTVTEEEPFVANDFCVDAIPVSIGPDVITGSTINSTEDGVKTCMNVAHTGFGVWYAVQGNGRRLIASTCSNTESTFDTKISVFSGDSCGNLTCVVADDNGCGIQSRAVFRSKENVTYYILVHGSVGGDFGLVVDMFVPALANDFCSAAQGPIIPNGEVILGSTLDSSFDNVGYCGADNTSPGVWFFVLGTGERLTADTCDERTDFDTKISIFTGSNCGNLTCVTGNDDGCGLQSSISWDTEIGRFYFILLHGWGTNTFGEYAMRLSGSTYFD